MGAIGVGVWSQAVYSSHGRTNQGHIPGLAWAQASGAHVRARMGGQPSGARARMGTNVRVTLYARARMGHPASRYPPGTLAMAPHQAGPPPPLPPPYARMGQKNFFGHQLFFFTPIPTPTPTLQINEDLSYSEKILRYMRRCCCFMFCDTCTGADPETARERDWQGKSERWVGVEGKGVDDGRRSKSGWWVWKGKVWTKDARATLSESGRGAGGGGGQLFYRKPHSRRGHRPAAVPIFIYLLI